MIVIDSTPQTEEDHQRLGPQMQQQQEEQQRLGLQMHKTSIARVCLIYLQLLDQDILVQKIRESFPLAQYCAQYWIGYAAASKEDKELHGLIMDFFLYRKRSYINWYHLCDPDLVFGGSASLGRRPADALYYVSIGGLKYEVKDL